MIAPHIHIPYTRIAEHIELLREKSLNLEIYFPGDALDAITRDDLDRTRQLLDYGPSLSFHAPFMDLSPGAVDSLVRKATMKRLGQILDVAQVLRPKVVVCHSGYEKWRYALKPEWWLEQSLITWKKIRKRAEDAGTQIAIENIFEDEPSNLKMLMEGLQSKIFGICFDTGHFNLFSKSRIDDWMEALNPHIIELHLHDNDRTSDQHLPIGDGTFDFGKFFHLLKNRDCIHTIEAHSPAKVMRSMQNLSRLTGTASDS